MPKKVKQKSRQAAGYVSRTRIFFIGLAILVLAATLTGFALYMFRLELVTTTNIPTEPLDVSVSKTIVTPGMTSDVPSLKAADTTSNYVPQYQSTNWAGYLSTGGSFTSVSGSWVASTPTPTSTIDESGDGTWVGIGGITSSDLIQIGTQNTISPTGIVSTSAFYELLPANAIGIVSLTIHPGNMISASITQSATDEWALTLANVTTGQIFSTIVTYNSSLSSAEWIQEDPSNMDGSYIILDNFGTVQFHDAMTTVNGAVMVAGATNASSITLIGQGGAAGHSGIPSALKGSAFTVQYH